MGTRSKTHAFRKSRVFIDWEYERTRTIALSVGFSLIVGLALALVAWAVGWWRRLG